MKRVLFIVLDWCMTACVATGVALVMLVLVPVALWLGRKNKTGGGN